MRLKNLLLLVLTLLFINTYAQKHTISGYIYDKETGEGLIGANIYDPDKRVGTVTNTYGFFSITLPEDTYTFIFSYVGYAPQFKKIKLLADLNLKVNLVPSLELNEVEINATQTEKIEEMTKMSTIDVPVEQIKELPALLGEADVLKTIQLLPGVQSGTEGSSGFYVRGGGPDQNLILLDGTPVYNASHLFGFFSVFNADAIKKVELIKGGFPARYGGRLSSVLDIHMKEGNMKKIQGQGSIGIIASKMTIEGPIIKDKTSFIVSARRTYADILAQPIIRLVNDDESAKMGYYFYDFNAKVNHKFSDKNRLFASLYMGDDRFYSILGPYEYLYDGVIYSEESSSKLGWGNLTSALRWNHQYNEKLFGNLTMTYSKYHFYVKSYEAAIEENDAATVSDIFSLEYFSGIEDVAAKLDFDYLPNPNHYIKFGLSNIYHTFHPGATTYQVTNSDLNTDVDSFFGAKKVYANEISAYLEDDYKISKHLKANLGLHYSSFLVKKKNYHSIQPRLAARYLFDGGWSVKSSYAYMQQYIHLLTNSTIGLPTDLWVPSTDLIKPENSHQVAVGIAKTIADRFQFTLEGYYKWMNNLIEYKDGATFLSEDTDWQNKIETGKGWSYGGEIFLQKKIGKTKGWIGYTLSWTNRKFDNINFGEIYPYKYDRRHDISVVVMQEIDELWDFSATWVYGTGNALTLATVRYQSYQDPMNYLNPWDDWGEDEIESFDKKNNFRMAAYHRLDLSFRRTKKLNWGESIWTFGVYNVYNRTNPFYYYFDYDSKGNKALKRLSLFPFLPSVSYSIKF